MAPLHYQEVEFVNMAADIIEPASNVLPNQSFPSDSILSHTPPGSAESEPFCGNFALLMTAAAIPSATQLAWRSNSDFAWATGEAMPVDDATEAPAIPIPPTPSSLHDQDNRLHSKSGSGAHVCAICGSDFGRRCDLSRHEKNHTRPRRCHYCPDKLYRGAPTNKDLRRHMWSRHPDTARALNIPKAETPCNFPGCNYRGRADNVRRHRKQKGH